MSRKTFALNATLAVLLVAAVTVGGARVGLNPTTMGFLYLVVILIVALRAGLLISTVTSLLAAACFNYFSLPPVHTFTVADPNNWVALSTFLAVSVLVTRLVVRARVEAAESEARANEIRALYNLSIDLFTSTNRVGALGEAASRAILSIGAAGGGLVLFDGSPHRQNVATWIGGKEDFIEELIAGVGRHGDMLEFPAPHGRDVYLPLSVGGRPTGVLVARAVTTARNVLESVAALVALAVEREKFLAENAHLQALRESELLKTSLLRAVSHDLKTPLTAISLHIGALRRLIAEGAAIGVVDELEQENNRLRRRIDNLLSMARLESGKVVPRPEPIPPGDLFLASLENLALLARTRTIETHVERDCPDAFVDASLAVEIIVNLVENAHRASPPGKPIEIVARRHPVDEGWIRIEILDRGSGIGGAGVAYRELMQDAKGDADGDLPSRGLGLEIARSLAIASGGSVSLTERPGGGAVARVDLPAAPVAAIAENQP
jgi:two-component system, OmpR family, sensor histidine kinase KdpD